MATARKDKTPYDKKMELYQLDIFYLEKEESVQEFLNRLPSTIVIKEEIKKKGKSFTYEYFITEVFFVKFLSQSSLDVRKRLKIQSIKIILFINV